MLEVLLLALGVLKDEARPLNLEVNWQKTKIQSTTDPAILLRHQFIYPATPWMSWSHSSTLALKFTVLVAQNQKCVVGLAWPKLFQPLE